MLFNAIYIIVLYIAQQARALVLACCVLFPLLNVAQPNLITNPSFETSSAIPNTLGEFNKCQDWYPVFGTPDYYSAFSPLVTSSCNVQIPYNSFGYQMPKTGNFYSGIFLRALTFLEGYPAFSNYFELIGNEFTQPLSKDHVYDFKLFYSLANGSGKLTNQLSAYFSTNQFTLNTSTFNPLSLSWYSGSINYINPQVNHDTTQLLSADTLNWQPLQGCFKANGGEQYVTIGNFRDGRANRTNLIPTNFIFPCNGVNSDECYIYVDDVSLYDVGYYAGNAKCKNDTLICVPGNTVAVGLNIKDSAQYSWQPAIALSCTNCPNPIGSPSVNTTYIVTKTLCSIVTKDTIKITLFTQNELLIAEPNSKICAGDSLTLGLQNLPYYSYSWQPSLSVSCATCQITKVSPLVSTTYTVTRSACAETKTATVKVGLKTNYTATPKLILSNIINCLKDTLKFKALNIPPTSVNYNWQPANLYLQTGLLNAKASIENNSYYYYTIDNNNTDTTYCLFNKKDSIYISLPDTCDKYELILPQAITANGDGINDEIKIVLPDTKSASLYVYNRWGNLVHSANAVSNGKVTLLNWNGTYNNKPLPDGTYFYLVEAIADDGTSKSYKQFVVLMR